MEHRLAYNAGLTAYTKYWLGPQEQIGEAQADLNFTTIDVLNFEDDVRARLLYIRRAPGRRLQRLGAEISP